MPYFDLKAQLAPKCKKAVAPIVGSWSYTATVGEGSTPIVLATVDPADPAQCGGTIRNEGCYDIIVDVTFIDGDDCNACTSDTLSTVAEQFSIGGNQGYTLPDSFWQQVEFTVVDSNGDPVDITNGTQVVTMDSAYSPKCPGCLVYPAVVVAPPQPVVTTFDVSLFLEGPFDSGPAMRTTLNDLGLLPGQTPIVPINPPTPEGQPYGIAPWNYAGGEGTAAGPGPHYGTVTPYPANIVDWVLVSVRTSLNPGDTVFTGAGLLANDGTVTMFVTPTLLESTDYYIVVEHRNHLASISPATQVVGGLLTYDFRANNTTGQIGLAGGVFGLTAGNGDQVDGRTIISNPDDVARGLDDGSVFSYLPGDFNMNGDTNSADRAMYINNTGLTTGVLF